MKYSDLVKFEPIESVIQLEQADSADAVRQLVQTFVISKGMAEQLCDIVIPNLQFETPADNKGVLIVGNYGTGKSHLLSLISGLAEYPDMAQVVKHKHKDVAQAAKAISGKFKVVRLELPATRKSLRNIICGRLEDFLAKEDLSFNFPADDQVDSNKDDPHRVLGDRRGCVAAARPVAGADGYDAERVAGETDGPHGPQCRRFPPEDQSGLAESEG